MPGQVDRYPAPSSAASGRWFFVAAAVLLLVAGLVGFGPFYLHGKAYPNRDIAPEIKSLVIAHGVAMTGWLVVMIVQPMLGALGRRRMHMSVGRVAAGFAGVIVVLGLWVAVASARTTPPDAVIWGLHPRAFTAIPIFTILLFAVFVALGVIHRKKPSVHRAMMLLATLNAIGAAVSRIDPLNNLYMGSAWQRLFGPFLFALVIGVVLLGVRCVMLRRVDRAFAAGLGVLIIAAPTVMVIARTSTWDRLMSTLVP